MLAEGFYSALRDPGLRGSHILLKQSGARFLPLQMMPLVGGFFNELGSDR